METYKQKWTGLQEQIFRFLCIHSGEEFNLRKIAGILNVSPTAVSNSVPFLSKEGLIVIEKSKTMNLVLIKFNRESEKAVNLKRVFNLMNFYESGIKNYLEENFSGSTVLLFGSYSKGEDVYFGKEDEKNSDLDIAVIGAKEKKIELSKFEKFLEREIVINFYPSLNGIHKNLRNNILNGILISGGIEL